MSNAPSESESPLSVAPQKERLGKLALKGSIYEILSFGVTQSFRLLANLLLTRLLFPEAFGLSAMIAIFNQGLVMLSDVGIAPGVIQSSKGDDTDFLNTAWTMHVVRGATLFSVALLLAWPVSWLYEEPQLGPLLAVGSLNVLIAGFDSTSLITLLRRIDARRTMLIELSSQLVGLSVTIAGAYWFRSVWALVVGGLVATISKTLASHFVIDVGYRNRFHWSKEATQEIVRFGKWIFFSSAVQFFAQQTDRLFLGKFIGLSELGIYTVAIALADLGATVVTRLTYQIFFPLFSRVHRDEPHRLQEVYYRTRLAMDAVTLPAAGVLFVIAPWVIDLLYDQRYEQAGWMLQILTLRVAFTCIVVPCETCLFSMGHSYFGFLKSVTRAVWMIVGLPLGFHWYGMQGVVWVTALSEMPALLILIPAFARKGIFLVRRELLVPVFFGLGVGIAGIIGKLIQ